MPAKFGTVIGIAPGGVPAHSSDYDSADSAEYPFRSSYKSIYKGIYCGYKFQCVEFARRWLVHCYGITFGDVHMAYEIFDIPFCFVAGQEAVPDAKKAKIPVVRNRNGDKLVHKPGLGSILMWNEGGYFRYTGHVAIITEATDTYVRIAEQNVTDDHWPNGRNYARELPVKVSTAPDGSTRYFIGETERGSVLGWVNPDFSKAPNATASASATAAPAQKPAITKRDFGEELGVTPQGIVAFSNDSAKAPRAAEASVWGVVASPPVDPMLVLGTKYGSIEFARRWLMGAFGVTFGSVRAAADVAGLTHFTKVLSGPMSPFSPLQRMPLPPGDRADMPVRFSPNGQTSRVPAVGAVIIWGRFGRWEATGHLGIVVDAAAPSSRSVGAGPTLRIAEQAFDDEPWQGAFSREIACHLGADQRSDPDTVLVLDSDPDVRIIGWLELATSDVTSRPSAPATTAEAQ